MSNGLTISGRKHHIAYEFYETPNWATRKAVEAMLSDGILDKQDLIYEPCCGAGAMTDVLKEYGFERVLASDIQIADYITGETGVDVYQVESDICDTVFTNPPYDRMTKNDMLQEFLRISSRKVILLLNIFYLSSKDRKEMLEQSHLYRVYIHSDRVTMYPYGTERPKNGGTKMFAWFVWDKEYNGDPTIKWI